MKFNWLVIAFSNRKRYPGFHKRRSCIDCSCRGILVVFSWQQSFRIDQMNMRIWFVAQLHAIDNRLFFIFGYKLPEHIIVMVERI